MRRLTALAVTLILSAGVAFTTTPASAADGFPPSVGSGGNVGGSQGGGTGGGSQSGGGTGGAHSTPSPAPAGYEWRSGGKSCPTDKTCHYTVGSTAHQGAIHSGKCAPRKVAGESDWYATGVTWTYAVSTTDGSIIRWQAACHFPPKPQDSPVRCVGELRGVITQEKGPAAVRGVVNTTVRSAWMGDREDPDKCAGFNSINVNAPMDQLGGYLVTVRGTTYPCTKRTYPATSRSARIVRCGGLATQTKSVKGGIWCGKGGVDWALGPASWGHEFSWAACADESTDLIDCALDATPPTYAGHRADLKAVQVLDDGKPRPLRFAALRPRGPVVSINNVVSSVWVDRSSTPWRSGAIGVDSADQPFAADGGFASKSKDQTVWSTAFYAAGAPAAPWTAHKTANFDARVRIKAVRIQRVDFNSMAVTTSEFTKVVTATGLSCKSPTAMVAVLRARNSSN